MTNTPLLRPEASRWLRDAAYAVGETLGVLALLCAWMGSVVGGFYVVYRVLLCSFKGVCG